MESRSGEKNAGYATGSHSELLSNSGRLTSDQLSELPRRNNGHYILAYIQEQRGYIKHYVSAGRTESNPWHEHHSESQGIPDLGSGGNLDGFNLGTPVLIARNSKPGNCNAALDSQRGDNKQNPLGGSLTQVTPQEDSDNRQKTSPPRIRGTDSKDLNKATTNIVVHHSLSTTECISKISNHEDTEKAKRLSERRHRKRVKRDIMKPPTSPEKENREEHPPKVSRKMGKCSTTRTKVQTQAGFALMHGLSATNVGKNRLTLNPLVQNVGVFKKGKASRVAKLAEMMSKKQDISSVHFSELKFLGKRTRKTSQTSSTPTASNHSDVSNKKPHSSQDRPLAERTTRQDEGQDSEMSEVKSVQGETSRRPYNPQESIIWDIEKESHNAETDCGTSDRPGSILMNLCVDAPHSKADVKERPLTGDDLTTSMKSSGWVPLHQNLTANVHSGDRVSFLSLGPSQSASQICMPEAESERQNIEYDSKYFKKMATTPNHISEPPEVHNPASLGETLVPPPHAADLQASHPASICHFPQKAFEHCFMTIEPSCNSMDIDGIDNLPTCSTHTGEGQSYLSHFDFSLLSYPALPDAWKNDDPEGLNGYLYQGSDVITDPCYVSESVLTETYEVNKQLGAGELVLETLSDDLGTYRIPVQYGAMQDEVHEEQGVDFQTGRISLDHFNNQEESDIQSEILYIWAGQSSASIRDDHLSEKGSDIDENCFGSSDFEPESDLLDNFHQGRALLFGLNQTYQEELRPKASNRLLSVEAEVAGRLKQNHWLPLPAKTLK